MQNSAAAISSVDSRQKRKEREYKGARPRGSKNKKLEYTKEELERIPLWDSQMLAQYVGLSYITVKSWRVQTSDADNPKSGPPYIKVNCRSVRYRRDDVKAWLAKQTRGVA